VRLGASNYAVVFNHIDAVVHKHNDNQKNLGIGLEKRHPDAKR